MHKLELNSQIDIYVPMYSRFLTFLLERLSRWMSQRVVFRLRMLVFYISRCCAQLLELAVFLPLVRFFVQIQMSVSGVRFKLFLERSALLVQKALVACI